ncbi:MAG: DMT family transporter [Rhodobacteraceae bacterium]|nr:DMT family transporter [Paracoccaceae bacterium]
MLPRGQSAKPLTGIALHLGAITVLVTMAACIKIATVEVPTGQAVFARAAFSLPLILGWIALQGPLRDGLRMERPRLHLLRGLIGTLALSLNFLALSLLPLPEVTAIEFAAPLVTVVFAVLLLGETVRLLRWSAVFVGLIGVLIIVWPRLGLGAEAGETDWARIGALAALGSACAAALVKILLRRMVITESTPAIAFYFALTASLIGLASAPFGWVWPSAKVAALLVASGLLGGIGQLMLTASYRYADASALAPFWYAQFLFATAFGVFLFGDLPTTQTLLGAALVIAAGLLIAWRESRLAKAARLGATGR